MENSVSVQEIEVVVSMKARFIPENVVFMTFFNFTTRNEIELSLNKSDIKLLDFIKLNKFGYKYIQMKMSNNDLEFECPTYQITLNPNQFPLLEKYVNRNPEVSIQVMNSVFTKKDKDRLINNMTVEAWRQADEIAIKKGLVLKNEYKSEEITEMNPVWTIGPPASASARYDHFEQPLSATYKFIFKTL